MRRSATNHLKVLGIIEVVYGTVHVLGFLALGAMSFLGCSICANADRLGDGLAAGATWTFFWGLLGIGGAFVSAIPVVAGLALANGRTWAKIATVIFAILMVAEFPVGTAFAVYAFWALFFDESRSRF
jgi:hypothetical protein